MTEANRILWRTVKEKGTLDNPIKVLIADDDPIFREILSNVISSSGDFKIVGKAADGRQALEMTLQLKPEIILLDLVMPKMDGNAVIREIMEIYPIPIVVLTAYDNTALAFHALSAGAVEIIAKKRLREADSSWLFKTLKLMSQVKVFKRMPAKEKVVEPAGEVMYPVVVIGSSAGGPKALWSLLVSLPASFPATVMIAQHIDPFFIPEIVRWLGDTSGIPVVVAKDGEKLEKGFAYFAPADCHLTASAGYRVSLVPKTAKDIYIPSVDMLLSTAAAYGNMAVGVILSGMGRDGSAGIREIKMNGGVNVAQDESTSIIFGMPAAAIESGCVDYVLPIEKIGPFLDKLVRGLVPAPEAGRKGPG